MSFQKNDALISDHFNTQKITSIQSKHISSNNQPEIKPKN